jgi:hypothetical protein
MFAGYCQSKGRLGASFFFRRGHPKRGEWNGLFPTIAYQLAKAIPEFMLPLQQVVDRDIRTYLREECRSSREGEE